MTDSTLNEASHANAMYSESEAIRFPALLALQRRVSRPVKVGQVIVGGGHPPCIQSMLTCPTWDITEVINQMEQLQQAGCELVRVTVPTDKDAQALPDIRDRMHKYGITMPLVADIHFNPRLALRCTPYVHKVRINPGNYVDQKRFQPHTYTDLAYQDELNRVEEALLPLIEAVKKHDIAIRVGVNHGSLSDRVVNRYGDTSQGMVECALEYLRIFAGHGFDQLIVSMKSSNPLVAMQAYRLLTLQMDKEQMDYPLHLGVTEAGDGLPARVKSAIGIGGLLADGLGDTIRVSLTESASAEIPAARAILSAVAQLEKQSTNSMQQTFEVPLDFQRRKSETIALSKDIKLGGMEKVPLLAISTDEQPALSLPKNEAFDGTLLQWDKIEHSTLLTLTQAEHMLRTAHSLPAACLAIGFDQSQVDSKMLDFVLGQAAAIQRSLLLLVMGKSLLYPVRRLVKKLNAHDLGWPVGIMLKQQPEQSLNQGLDQAMQVGTLAADGLIDALACPALPAHDPLVKFCHTLLQATRLRAYETEYISCPSCGRTLFDLEETSQRIQARTRHLKGVRIGIMGCIVNGPGEMADADFGYVGGTAGHVNLYKGQTCVERGVPEAEAVERLVDLLKANNAWEEQPPA